MRLVYSKIFFLKLVFSLASVHAVNKIDFVFYSYDRPLQLYACLESTEKYLTERGEAYCIVRTSQKKYEQQYKKVEESFKWCKFLKEGSGPRDSFEFLTMLTICGSPNRFFFFGVDDNIFTDFIDTKIITSKLDETNSFGFFLRLGKNITKCYSEKINTPVPINKELSGNVFSWEFKNGKGDWNFPINTDVTIYKKENVIRGLVKTLSYCTFNHWEGLWANEWANLSNKSLWINVNPEGLFFEKSKVINLNLNNVKDEKNEKQYTNYWRERLSHLSADFLYNKFEDGFKIDINRFFQFNNDAPHVEVEP